MGAVYLGFDEAGGPVAVKTLPAGAGKDLRRRLRREADLLARVSHPRVAGFLGADVDAAVPWLAMTYISGPSLTEVTTPLSEVALTQLLSGLAEALTALHAGGLIHRDVKPGNIIMTFDGPVLVDLGIATGADLTELTLAGTTVGTPGWMSPEQLTGSDIGPATDVWAWGAVGYYAATGRQPFGDGALAALAWRIQNAEPDWTLVSPGLRSRLQAAMTKDAKRRPEPSELLRGEAGTTRRVSASDVDSVDRRSFESSATAPGQTRQGSHADGLSTNVMSAAAKHRRLTRPVAVAVAIAVVAAAALVLALHPWTTADKGSASRGDAAATTTSLARTSQSSPVLSTANTSTGSSPTAASLTPPPVAITTQLLRSRAVCKQACTISGQVPFTHPVWGASTLVSTTSLDNGTPVGPANIAVIDSAGTVQWSIALANMYSLAPLPTPTDSTGHIFLNYNPGRYNGVIVLAPIGTGMDDFQSLPLDAQPAGGAFYSATAADVDHDGQFEIDRSLNDCTPNCASGKQVHEIYRWTGTKYVRTR
jgi:serine/threonine protein kinase